MLTENLRKRLTRISIRDHSIIPRWKGPTLKMRRRRSCRICFKWDHFFVRWSTSWEIVDVMYECDMSEKKNRKDFNQLWPTFCLERHQHWI